VEYFTVNVENSFVVIAVQKLSKSVKVVELLSEMNCLSWTMMWLCLSSVGNSAIWTRDHFPGLM